MKQAASFLRLCTGILLSVLIGHSGASAQSFTIDTILFNGNPGKYINLVFMGDGFRTAQLGTYISEAQALSAYLFTISPFAENKAYFNVFAINVPSTDSGADHPGTASDVVEPAFPVSSANTYFSSTFDYGSIHRLLVAQNFSGINTVLFNNFPLYDQPLMLVNTPYYGGSGGSTATSSLDMAAYDILVHEIGHSFANLADEYWAGNLYAAERANMTQQTNSSLVKWKNWIGVGGVGIYQHCCGGNSALWYRPHNSCKMRTLSSAFCPVCKEALVERIHQLFGTVIESRLPLQDTIPYCAQPLKFKISTIKNLPNTLRVKWKLNSVDLGVSLDSVMITSTQLAVGSNTLTVEVLDTTLLTRDSLHAINHLYKVVWTINHDPLGTPTITASGPTSFCQGDSVILTASAANSYLWSNSSTTPSITVTSAGSYSVVLSNAYGCTASVAPTVVTVNSLPTAAITASGATTFCQGDSVTLTAGSASSYLWSNSATTQSIKVYAAGSYSVRVTNAAGCAANSAPTVVTINSLPTAAITASGPTTFCQGDSVTLTAGPASSYVWSNSATTQSIRVYAAGSYSVRVTDSNGCAASSSVTSVSVNALPAAAITASGPTTFCQGDSVMLTASPASSYLWSNGATTPGITVLAAGTYSVRVTDSNGCSASSSALSVVVNPLPPTPLISRNGMTLTSSALTGNQWYLNDTLIAGATGQNHTVTQDGNYSVVVTDSNQCQARSAVYVFTAVHVPVTSADKSIVVIPNPNGGIFRIETKGLQVLRIEIRNALGALVYKSLWTKPEIDISDQARGIYFIAVYTGHAVHNARVVVQ